MDQKFLTPAFMWGTALWLFGYALAFVIYPFLAVDLLGWAVMPFGVAFTLWVLLYKPLAGDLKQHVLLGFIWAALAIILDYIFIVQALHPANGYYKLDVYLYYALAFALPCAFGIWKYLHRQRA